MPGREDTMFYWSSSLSWFRTGHYTTDITITNITILTTQQSYTHNTFNKTDTSQSIKQSKWSSIQLQIYLLSLDSYFGSYLLVL